MDNTLQQKINTIIRKKIPVFFVSPHLDDAVLSAGDLIAQLSKKTRVTVVTVFSESDKNLSLSAKQFLKQCNYKSAEELFQDRRKEDKRALELLGAKVVHLGFADALFRKKHNQNIIVKTLAKVVPEFSLLYPTYRFHIAKGDIQKQDIQTKEQIAIMLQGLIGNSEKAVLFTALGIGNHVDHILTKEAVAALGVDTIYWFDQPYALQNHELSTYPFGRMPQHLKKEKMKALHQYKTQVSALFGKKIPNYIPEQFSASDILQNHFPLQVQDYFFVQEISKPQAKKTYRFGLYKNTTGQKAFAKLWVGKRRNSDYYFLKNEKYALELFRTKNAQSNTTHYVSFPSFLFYQESKHSSLLLMQYIEGKSIVKAPISQKVQAIGKVLDYFDELNKRTVHTHHSKILQRNFWFFLAGTTYSVVLGSLKHPRDIHLFLRGFLIFLKNVPLLYKQKYNALVHRDIGEKNIFISGKNVYFFDFQLTCFSNKWFEYAVAYTKSYFGKFPHQIYTECIKDRLLSIEDAQTFLSFCMFLGLFNIGTVESSHYLQSLDYIQLLISNAQQFHVKKQPVHEVTGSSALDRWHRIFYQFQPMLSAVAIFLLCLPILLMVMKGDKGTPLAYQLQRETKFGGPFELSISAARFALTESIVKYHSLFLPQNLAQFSAPDVALYKGKFISLFTPGISFVGIPFYMVGLLFGTPQLSAYFLNVVVAIINVFLLVFLTKSLGYSKKIGTLAGFIFLFATNSLAYTSTFTQHHVTIALLLSLLLLALRKPSFFGALLIGLLYGFGLFVDVPNLFLFFPVILFPLSKLFYVQKHETSVSISFHAGLISMIFGMLCMFGLFGIYNYATTGQFTKVAQFIGEAPVFKPALQNVAVSADNTNNKVVGLSLPFKTRNELFSAYILLLSDERSWLYYCPIVLVGLLGMLRLLQIQEKKSQTLLLFSLIAGNIVTYCMFGDPWGGWAFGSRYLLPSAALLCIYTAIAFSMYKKNIIFVLAFIFLTVYSLKISLLGALTTIAIPPKVEAIHMITPVPYTSQYNQNLVNSNYSSSLIFNLFLKQVTSVRVYFLVAFSYCATVLFALMALVFTEKSYEK